jgi:hypothetical protein
MTKYFNRCVFTDGKNYSPFINSFRGEFDTRFLNPDFTPVHLETPYKNVKLALPGEYLDHPILKQQPQFEGSYSEYLLALKDALKKHLLTLDDNTNYLFSHSSGMDSRFISGTMAELRDQKSFKNVHFRCHAPENSVFKKIMEKSGWDKSQYSTYDPNDSVYNIGVQDVCVNGWQSYSNQMNYWPDFNPKEWVIITGEGGELFKYIANYKDQPFEYTENYQLNMLIQHNPGRGEWDNQNMAIFKDAIMPLWSFDYLSVSNQVRSDFVQHVDDIGYDNIRKDLVKSVGLDGFPNVENDYLVSWVISPSKRESMLELFYNTNFYKEFNNLIPTDIDFFTDPFGWESKVWGFAVTVYG